MDFKIQLNFRNSSSVYLSDAKKHAKKFDDFKEADSNKKINSLTVSQEALRRKSSSFLKVWEIVKSWKGTEILLNDDPIDQKELNSITDVINCNSEYHKAVIQEDHCKIRDDIEGWGCKFLNSIARHSPNRYYWRNSNHNWYDFGHFEEEYKWKVDKQKIKEVLKREARLKNLNLCSVFNLETVFKHVDTLPDEINVEESESWEIKYEESIDGNTLEKKPIGIKPHQNNGSSSSSLSISFGAQKEEEEKDESTENNRHIPDVEYEDIGGIDGILQKIREAIEIPFLKPELIKHLGIQPHKGVLLAGPPGTGKTLIAKAIANQVNAHFISIKGPELLSKWHGQSEENLRKVFEEARINSPSIIFFDEIDSIAQERSNEESLRFDSRFVNQLLTLMDGLEEFEDVRIIATTNRIELLDKALLRPGRFDYKIEVTKPDLKGCLEILKIHTKDMPIDSNFNLELFSAKLLGLTGAEIAYITRESAYNCLRRSINGLEPRSINEINEEHLSNFNISRNDFEKALKSLK